MAKPELSVVVSALNEEKTVRSVLEQILKVFDKYKIKGEIVFMDNHSTDKTGYLADQVAKKDKRARVIHRKNRPNTDLGSSLREGFANAKGTYVIIMDCDLSHSPDEIPNLLKHKDEADIIIGSRYAKGGKADMSLKRSIISRSFNLMTKIIAGTNVVEIFLKAINKGCKAIEVPIHYRRADKKSTLNYRKQFFSYAKPVLSALKEKYFG